MDVPRLDTEKCSSKGSLKIQFGERNPSVEACVVKPAAVLGRDGWAVLGCWFPTVWVDGLAVVRF